MITALAITEISCGQDVHRRVGAAIGLALISFGAGDGATAHMRTREVDGSIRASNTAI